jgi:MFS family permease
MVGLAYSIYAAAIWGSIPYVVLPHTVGTAFGLAMAVQNIGLSFAPAIVAYIKDNTTRMFGYYYVELFFIIVNVIGLACNITLYYVDIKYNNGILDKVDKGETLLDMVTSPTQNESRKELLKHSMAKDENR